MPTAKPPRPALVVAQGEDEALDQLVAMRAQLKEQLAPLEDQLSQVKAVLKRRLYERRGEFERVTTPGAELRWVPRRELDTTRLRVERPDIYEEYTKDAGRWELR